MTESMHKAPDAHMYLVGILTNSRHRDPLPVLFKIIIYTEYKIRNSPLFSGYVAIHI